MYYVIYEKTEIERPNETIEDEINIGDSVSVKGVIKFLKTYRNLETNERSVYRAIKENKPINDKFFIYKIIEKLTD